MNGIARAPSGGPRLAAIGWEAWTVAIAEPSRLGGVIIAWIAMMMPPLPKHRPINSRTRISQRTSSAQAAMSSATASRM